MRGASAFHHRNSDSSRPIQPRPHTSFESVLCSFPCRFQHCLKASICSEGSQYRQTSSTKPFPPAGGWLVPISGFGPHLVFASSPVLLVPKTIVQRGILIYNSSIRSREFLIGGNGPAQPVLKILLSLVLGQLEHLVGAAVQPYHSSGSSSSSA